MAGKYSAIAAYTLGADYIEFHTVFDKKMFGPDSTSSLTIKQVKKLSDSLKDLYKSFNSNPKKENFVLKNNKNLFTKSLSLNKNKKPGEVINVSDLETKKPSSMGIQPKDYKNIIGRRLKRNFKMGEFINYEDLEND